MSRAPIVRFSVFAMVSLALLPFGAAQTSLAGDWQGTLDVNGQVLHVAWHALLAADGTLTSTIDNIDENIYGIKVKSLTLKGSEITMTVDDVATINGQQVPIRGDFAGTLSSDGQELSGTWTQTDPEQPPFQVHFKRSTPKAPADSHS